MTYSLNSPPADDPRIPVINSMISDLGWCLNSYGQIEYLLGDIVWQGWRLPEYSHLAKQHPAALDNRVKEIERIFTLPGPFSPYAADIRLLIARLKDLEEPRHLFVHGHCSFEWTKGGDMAMRFRRFVPPPKGGQVTKYSGIVRPQSLKAAKFAWTVFAGTAQTIIGEMYIALGLEAEMP